MGTFLFLRHGETEYNRAKRMQGILDIPLNENGIRQAEEAAVRLRQRGFEFERVLSSPLCRAVKTASVISGIPEEKIPTDERLVERGFGVMEGAPFEEISKELRDFLRDPRNDAARPEGAETDAELRARLGSLLRDLEQMKEETVLITSHGSALRVLMRMLLGDVESPYIDRGLGNCHGILTEYAGGKWTILERIPALEETR